MVKSTNFSFLLKGKNKTKLQLGVLEGFSGGSLVKNLPAKAGDTGLISDLARSHMPGDN